jgi:hypothetical protein
MKTFNFTDEESLFAAKTYTVEASTPGNCKVSVRGAFLGNWTFNLKLDYNVACERLNTYCQTNDKYIQNIFPELSLQESKKFLTNPRMNFSKPK